DFLIIVPGTWHRPSGGASRNRETIYDSVNGPDRRKCQEESSIYTAAAGDGDTGACTNGVLLVHCVKCRAVDIEDFQGCRAPSTVGQCRRSFQSRRFAKRSFATVDMSDLKILPGGLAPSPLEALLALDQSVLDTIPSAIYVCAADGVVARYNRRAIELWGQSPGPGDTHEQFCASFRFFRLAG